MQDEWTSNLGTRSENELCANHIEGLISKHFEEIEFPIIYLEYFGILEVEVTLQQSKLLCLFIKSHCLFSSRLIKLLFLLVKPPCLRIKINN